MSEQDAECASWQSRVLLGLQCAGVLLFCLGVAGFPLLPLIMGFAGGGVPDFELPLGPGADVVVRADGEIYCSSTYYCKIQVYGPSGEYRHGWPVAYGARDSFRIAIDDTSLIHVAGEDSNGYVYDRTGKLVRKEELQGGFSGVLQGMSAPQRRDAQGNVVSVTGGLFAPATVVSSNNGVERVIVWPPFFLTWAASPVCSLLAAVIGFALAMSIRRLRKSARTQRD